MKKISKLLIIAVGMLMVAGSMAYASDVTQESSVGITGTGICTLSITSSDLTVSAPTTKGPSTTTFTNSPIALSFEDTDVNSASGTVLKVKISSTPPTQYGSSAIYQIKLGAGTFTAGADSEITAGEVSDDVGPYLTASDQSVLDFGTASGSVITGTTSTPVSLIVNADKRVHGDTSDSITIQYTLVDK